MARRFTSKSEYWSWWSKFKVTTQAGIAAMRQTWNEITDERYEAYEDRSAIYDRLWEYYTNTMFQDLSAWQYYMSEHGLYRHIRPIYNPISRLTGFYHSIYPGVLASDAIRPPDGAPLAVPLSDDTPDEVRRAIGNAWRWANWQENKDLWVTYSVVLGCGPIRIADDLDRRMVYPEVIWPGHIKELTLDPSGNVRSYVIEYETADTGESANPSVTYTEAVDQESVYKKLGDKVLVDAANPYGFVPMVWWRFQNWGTAYGAPAFAASIGKVDELNHLMSLIHDEVFKTVGAPLLLRGVVAPSNFPAAKRGSTEDFSYRHSDREEKGIIYAPNENAGIETLTTNVAEALDVAKGLQKEIEDDFPELTAYTALREMTQTTGPAVDALSADVRARFTRAAAAADCQQIKLWQMVLAIGGERVRQGQWGARGELDRIRQAFEPFSLRSYEQGDLDFSIDMRPLVYPSQATLYADEKALWEAVDAAKSAGVPVEVVLRKFGWDDRRIEALRAAITSTSSVDAAMRGAAVREAEEMARAQAAGNPRPASASGSTSN